MLSWKFIFVKKGVTLGPDVYTNDVSIKAVLSGQPTDVTLLPISFVAKDGQNGEWQYTAAESPLEVSVGEGSAKKSFLLESLPAPLINVVVSAASAGAGIAGSPTLFKNFIRQGLYYELPELIFSPLRDLLEFGFDECLPLVSINYKKMHYVSYRT